ncbi:MAG: dynamin family protein [Anaerolineales bacterium]
MEILSEEQQELLKRERTLLNELQLTLADYGIKKEDQTALQESIQQLDDFFLLVVVGEFNSGKSAFINALLGEKMLQEGVTPTTTKVIILRHGDSIQSFRLRENIEGKTAPVAFLKEISIVDTPGTNAIIREHEEITNRFIPRSDLILFVTSADRPFTESERLFLEQIRDWEKKVVIVVNKIDILPSTESLEEIETFIATNVRKTLDIELEIFPVSSQQALKAKQGQSELWKKSQFGALEKYILESLDKESRLELKLLNPLGVGKYISSQYADYFAHRLKVLKQDLQTIEDVEEELDYFRKELLETFQLRMSDILNILLEMERRGDEYFSETIRLGRIFDLVKKEKIQKEFERQVIDDVPERIERKVTGIVDWLVDTNLRQWQAVTDHIAEGRQKHRERMVGDIGTFHYDRERLINSIHKEATRVVESYDKKREAKEIARGAQNAVAATAVLGVGAVGLGTLVTILASTLAADVSGILVAGVLAALGIFVIPAKRRQAKETMHKKLKAMREKLTTSLGNHFEHEIEHSLQEIRGTIAPYTRFIRAEQEKNQHAYQKLRSFEEEIEDLSAQIKTSGE